jgi:glycosyltransferase involved in cell wall biosynthesis
VSVFEVPVTYLSRSVVPSRLANSVHVMKMACAFSACGRDVTLVCQSDQYRQVDAEDLYGYYGVGRGFRLVRLDRGRVPGRQLIYAWRASRIARKIGTESLVYCRDIWSCLFAAEQGMRVALEVHAMDMFSSAARRMAFSRIIQSKRFGFIVAISKALEKDLLDAVPELRGRTLVAHDAADVVPDEFLALRSSGRRESFNVGYTGHLYRGRGITLILDVAARTPWATFHIVGGHPSDIDRVRREVAGRGLENVVIHGFVPPGELDRLRVTFDVVIAPYEQKVSVDGGGDTTRWMSPMKIFEYMALGLPIVCSDLPVLREILSDGVNALLVPPNDPGAWSAALVRLRDDPVLAEWIARNALQQQRAEFNWVSRAGAILEFARHLI